MSIKELKPDLASGGPIPDLPLIILQPHLCSINNELISLRVSFKQGNGPVPYPDDSVFYEKASDSSINPPDHDRWGGFFPSAASSGFVFPGGGPGR
jgi:hypothetical protein